MDESKEMEKYSKYLFFKSAQVTTIFSQVEIVIIYHFVRRLIGSL